MNSEKKESELLYMYSTLIDAHNDADNNQQKNWK